MYCVANGNLTYFLVLAAVGGAVLWAAGRYFGAGRRSGGEDSFYCVGCGAGLREDWNHCPICGQTRQKN